MFLIKQDCETLWKLHSTRDDDQLNEEDVWKHVEQCNAWEPSCPLDSIRRCLGFLLPLPARHSWTRSISDKSSGNLWFFYSTARRCRLADSMALCNTNNITHNIHRQKSKIEKNIFNKNKLETKYSTMGRAHSLKKASDYKCLSIATALLTHTHTRNLNYKACKIIYIHTHNLSYSAWKI